MRWMRHFGVLFSLVLSVACGGASREPEWPPTAKKWFDRAEYSYRTGDLEDATHASERALAALPDQPEVRLLGARIALARLDFEQALELTADVPGSEAASIRGRAHWYEGHIDQAADELEALIDDPEVRDPWAEQVARLARTGRGRRPFEISGGLLAVSEMPRTGSTAMLVPVEVNGEPSLAMIATDVAEAVIDSRGDEAGSWVSLRFGERVEVSDVPAMGRDLSGLSRQVGAPVKMLIGVNLLRHLRATVDFSGSQFVVRNYDPPAPPEATTVHPVFYRGGAMVLPTAFGVEQSAPSSSLLMNTSMAYPVALDEGGWEKAGQDPAEFAAIPGESGLRHGTLPLLRLGAFEIPNVPGVVGAPVADLEETLSVDLDGFASGAPSDPAAAPPARLPPASPEVPGGTPGMSPSAPGAPMSPGGGPALSPPVLSPPPGAPGSNPRPGSAR